jgi:DNA polymerase I
MIYLDTETTGLRWQNGDMPFLIIIKENDGPVEQYSLIGAERITSEEWVRLKFRIENCGALVCHNIKFDMHMLANLGIDVLRPAWFCTMLAAKYVDNRLPSYSLDALTGQKSAVVAEWFKANPKHKNKYYSVPPAIMKIYAQRDVDLLAELLETMADQKSDPAVIAEMRCVKELWKMERRGLVVDPDYTLKALKHANACAAEARHDFAQVAGVPFVASGKALGAVFAKHGIELPTTEKGNIKVDSATLAMVPGPLGEIIQRIKKSEKRASTYFEAFLSDRGHDGAIHCQLNAVGADTLRMSSSGPNLQNVPSPDREPEGTRYPARGCFVPRPGFSFVSIDFNQQEYRLLMDLAGEKVMIDAVNSGLDIHEATAQMMGVSRNLGKTINFAIIYGAGDKRLAETLKVSVEEAKRLRGLYFSRLPMVQRWCRAVTRHAEEYKEAITVYGTRLKINPDMPFTAIDYCIQGSCAQITKRSILACAEVLKDKKSRMVLPIHDEILFEIHKEEHDLIQILVDVIGKVYVPVSGLSLTASYEINSERWGK